MGCICSKGGTSDIDNHVREKESKKSTKRFVASTRRDEVIVEVDNGGNEATARLISTEVTLENVSTPTVWDEGDKKKALVVDKPNLRKRATMENGGVSCGPSQISRVFSISGGVDGAQVSAGWPSWLTAVAGEAIKGWVPRKADSFEKLDKVYLSFKTFNSLPY